MMNLRLGKKETRLDTRTFKMASIFKLLAPPPPERYDFDEEHPGIPTPMFLNDEFGCCVMASRAHQTLRFEAIEQGRVLPISDEEVKNQYFDETGGCDTGLVELDSLKSWRKEGWKVGKEILKIHAFGYINWRKPEDMKACIFYLGGCFTGAQLPESAKKEFTDGVPWSDLSDEPGGWGGHAMIITAYSLEDVTFITWGKKQKATWGWVNKYCDEAYGVVDERDTWLGDKSPIDSDKLEDILRRIT